MGAWDKEISSKKASTGAWDAEVAKTSKPPLSRGEFNLLATPTLSMATPLTSGLVRYETAEERKKREAAEKAKANPLKLSVAPTKEPLLKTETTTKTSTKPVDTGVKPHFVQEFGTAMVRDVVMRWPLSAVESFYRAGKATVGGKGLSAFQEVYKPIDVPGIGKIKSIQSDYNERVQRGEDKAGLKAVGSTLADEPIGIAAKPLFMFLGFAAKKILPKTFTQSVDFLAKNTDEVKIYNELTDSLGLRGDAARKLVPALTKAETAEEVLRILKVNEDEAARMATKPFVPVQAADEVVETVGRTVDNVPPQAGVPIKKTYTPPAPSKSSLFTGKPVTSAAAKLTKVEQRTMQDVASANIDEMRQFTRGRVSDADALRAARLLGYNVERVMALDPTKPVSKEVAAAVSGIVTNERNILKNQDAALARMTIGSPEQVQMAVVRAEQYMKTMKLVAVERALASEAGRTLEATKRAVDAITESEFLLSKFLNNPKTTPEAREWVLKQLSTMKGTPEEIALNVRKALVATKMEMFVEFATAMKLSAIPTHLVNTITSTARMLTELPISTVSGAINAIESLIRGTKRERFIAADTINYVLGVTMAQKNAWKNAFKALMDEDFAYKSSLAIQDFSTRGPAIKGKPWRNNAWDKFLNVSGKVVRMPFRFLGVEDTLVRVPAQNAAMVREAGRIALESGAKPFSKEYIDIMSRTLQNPTAEMVTKAKNNAAEVLFQEELGPAMTKVARFRNEHPSSKLVVPFMKTIINLFRQSLQFSPLSPLLPSTRKALTNTAGTRADALAKMALGTSAMTPLFYMAQEGKITGAPPTNPAERDKFYNAEGKQPYSVLVNGKWVPYNRFSPFSEWFVMAKLVSDAVDKKDEATAANLAAQVFFSMSRNFLDKSFTRGMSDLLTALSDDKVDPDTGFSKQAELYLGNFVAGSLIPTGLSSIARSRDDKFREIDSFMDVIYSRIPGLSEKLPAKLDVFGYELVRPGTPLERLIMPAVPSVATIDIVSKELEDIGIVMGFPSSNFLGFEVPEEDQRTIRIIYGRNLYSMLEKIVTSPQWDQMPVVEKEKLVTRLRDDLIRQVREKYAAQNIILSELTKQLQEQKNMTKKDAKKLAEELLSTGQVKVQQ